MNPKFYCLAFILGAALAAPAQAGKNQNQGGGGNVVTAHPAPGRAAAPSFRSTPMRNFGAGRMAIQSQRFSSTGIRSLPTTPFRQRVAGFENQGNRLSQVTNQGSAAIQTQTGVNRLAQVGSGTLRQGVAGGNHVFAQRSANWHPDWNRRCDHWWHGHRCRFFNGSWIIFDLGFYPWWPYWYPYDYYAYDYYPYGYDPGVYDGAGVDYYSQGAYDSSDQSADAIVAAAQERLARQGYYRGGIDGRFGPETRRAVLRYQSDHGLHVTGYLTADTRQALGLR